MLYTSGTTAQLKGVLLSTIALEAQAQSLKAAWDYSPRDRLLHLLPLHHIHSTVNALLTPLLAGSSIEFMYPFYAESVWNRLAEPVLSKPSEDGKADDTLETNHAITHNGTNGAISRTVRDTFRPITFFIAVPTIWARIMSTYPRLSLEVQSLQASVGSYRVIAKTLSTHS